MRHRAVDLARTQIRRSAYNAQERDRSGRSDILPHTEELLFSAELIDKMAGEIRLLDAVLRRVDRNVTAAAKRAVKRMGHAPLRLNSRRAKRVLVPR